jgi:hypothetical protein
MKKIFKNDILKVKIGNEKLYCFPPQEGSFLRQEGDKCLLWIPGRLDLDIVDVKDIEILNRPF